MKTILRTMLLFVAAGSFVQLKAQGSGANCAVEQVGIQVTGAAQVNGKCQVTASISFVALERTGGQKYFTLHLWEQGKRPNLTFATPPSAADLNNDLRTIVIEDKGNATARKWQLSQTYNNQTGSPLVDLSNVTLTPLKVSPDNQNVYKNYKGYTFFVLSGVVFTVDDCSDMNLTADVWGSNNPKNTTVDCRNTALNVFECTAQSGISAFGNVFCGEPANNFQVGFANTGGCYPYFVTYEVYADVNKNGTIDSGEPLVSEGPGEDYAVVYPGATVTKTRPLNLNANLIMTNINTVTFSATGLAVTAHNPVPLTNGCTVLPVKFASFTAVRNEKNKQLVDLAWSTAAEQNNKGFYVQRNTGGTWKDVAFIFSAADNGNSNTVLSYQYKDVNASKEATQYRLLQVDLDNKASFSEIKSVKGLESTASVLIYPNPAVNGKVRVLFTNAGSIKDVVVSDMNGRVVKQFRDISNNSLTIEGLTSGLYTIKVIDHKTAAAVTEKVVVK